MRRLLLASSSSFSSSSSALLSLGCVGGDKSLLFSVAKRTTGGFSRIYRPGGRGDLKAEEKGGEVERIQERRRVGKRGDKKEIL